MPTPGLQRLGTRTASSPGWILGMVDAGLENSVAWDPHFIHSGLSHGTPLWKVKSSGAVESFLASFLHSLKVDL